MAAAAECLKVATWNVWRMGGEPALWPSRRSALMRTVQLLGADALLVQEAHPLTTAAILEARPDYRCVADDFAGWRTEGQIFWDTRLLEEVAHGVSDVGLIPPERRLFWVRLRSLRTGRTVLLSTAHLTWQGHPAEAAGAPNLRRRQAETIAWHLTHSLVAEAEPAIFGGDLNEGFWPRKVLHAAGLADCFLQAGRPVPPTHPAIPCGVEEEDTLDCATLDWLTGNRYALAIEAEAVGDMPRHDEGGNLQASDHCPVVAVYRLLTEPAPLRPFRPDVHVPPPASAP